MVRRVTAATTNAALQADQYPPRRWRRIPKWRPSQGLGSYIGQAIILLVGLQMLLKAISWPYQQQQDSSIFHQDHRLDQLLALALRMEQRVNISAKGNGRKRLHVMVLMGTRPEATKLAPIILEFKARPERFLCTVVSTAQHQAMLGQVLESFGIGSGSIDLSLNLMTNKGSLPAVTSRLMTSMSAVFQHLCPDMLLVQGDTTTAFLGALAAFYHKIPVGHVEAGLRTYSGYPSSTNDVNRQSIGILASLHFASSAPAADNLVGREGKDPHTVFLTGDPLVDAPRHYTPGMGNETSPTLATLRQALADRRIGGQPCRLVLLMAHRRGKHGQSLCNVLAAIPKILVKHPDVFVVYPVNHNPKCRKGIEALVPASAYRQLGEDSKVANATALSDTGDDSLVRSRLLLLPPLDYQDLVRIMNMSELVLTDSGGIQEEAAVLGKAIVMLHDTTERPEGVLAGVVRLAGTATADIVAEVDRLLTLQKGNQASRSVASGGSTLDVYGGGKPAERIVDIVDWYFQRDQGFPQSTPSPPVPSHSTQKKLYDLVLVLTVWKRTTLNTYLNMLSRQTLLRQRPGFRINVIVFQNGRHLDVAPILDDWRVHARDRWGEVTNVTLTYVQSSVSTGYYGRFLAPLLSKVRDDGYFVVCDDDVVFGTRYLENMVRVVDSGSLAVRVGRFIGDPVQDGTGGLVEHMGVSPQGWGKDVQVTFDDDVVYDFGGQVWAGKFDWLRTLWSHPPPVWITSEDFWISAVLQTQLDVHTKRPRCPANDVEQCACSMEVANDHRPVEVGEHSGGEFDVRFQAMGDIARQYAYQPLQNLYKEREARAYTFHPPGQGPFKVRGTWVEHCLYFI